MKIPGINRQTGQSYNSNGKSFYFKKAGHILKNTVWIKMYLIDSLENFVYSCLASVLTLHHLTKSFN